MLVDADYIYDDADADADTDADADADTGHKYLLHILIQCMCTLHTAHCAVNAIFDLYLTALKC